MFRASFISSSFTPHPLKWHRRDVCKPNRQKRPRPPPHMCTRPSLQAPQSTPSEQPIISAPTAKAASEAVTKLLSSNIDVLIYDTARFTPALQSPTAPFNALVLTPTVPIAQSAIAELGDNLFQSRVLPVLERGGTDPARKAIRKHGTIVIGTPRTLCSSFFRTRKGPQWLRSVDRLVLYDPDGMRELGCMPLLRRLMKFLPVPPHTVVIAPRELRMRWLLRGNARIVRWARESTAGVPERYAVTGPEMALSALGAALTDAKRVDEYKVVVFMPTGKLVQFYAALFRAMGWDVEEIHGRRSAASQMRALVMFAEQDRIIMFASEMKAEIAKDVRVTHVIQVGAPADRMQYERRVGVAMRGVGSSLLLLCDYEVGMAMDVIGKSIGVARCYNLEVVDEKFVGEAHEAMGRVAWQFAASGYMSFMSVYVTKCRALGWSKEELVRRGIEWARLTTGMGGWAVSSKFAERMGLVGVEGIVVEEGVSYELSKTREAGMIDWDRSLVGKLDPSMGPRGRNVLGRRLKEKRPKIKDWREVMKKVKEDEIKVVKKINRKSPEGRKYMANLARKAIIRDGLETARKEKEKKEEEEEKRMKEQQLLKQRPWATGVKRKNTWYAKKSSNTQGKLGKRDTDKTA